MQKNIWILHHYATPPSMSGLTRPYDFSRQLKKHGYKSTIFASAYLHYTSESLILGKHRYIEYLYDEIPFIFIRTPKYSGSGISRMRNMVSFTYSVLFASRDLIRSRKKPDVIYASSPHALTLIAGVRLAKRLGIPCICEVRDLWPESFVAYGIVKKDNLLLKLLYAGEKWIYKKADKLIFTMEGGKDYIIEKDWDRGHGGPVDLNKVYHINNGVDLDSFNYNKEHYKLDDNDLNDDTVFKVVYTGSIRLVNQVGIILDIAKWLQDNGHGSIKFLIYGAGDQVGMLEQRIKDEGIKNVFFKGRVDKKYIPYVTSKGNLNIVVGINRPLHRFGTSANKRFDYFASGRPTLATTTVAYSLIKRYKAGSEIPLNRGGMKDIEAIANEIIRYRDMPQKEYKQYCNNALKAAKDYDFKVLTEKLIDIINA